MSDIKWQVDYSGDQPVFSDGDATLDALDFAFHASKLEAQLAEARELLSVATCVCGVDDEWWIPRRDALMQAFAGEE